MERQVVYSGTGNMEDEGLWSQSPTKHLSAGRGFHKEGEGKLAVSLLVPIRVIIVSILELLSASQMPAGGPSASTEVVVKLLAPAMCLQRNCQYVSSFLSLLGHFILTPCHGESA